MLTKKGCWELQITTPAASFEEYTLTLTDGEQSVTLQHLLIGEVWLCAGQSNMVMPLNGFDYCPISDSNNVIADAPNHPGIRMVTIKADSKTISAGVCRRKAGSNQLRKMLRSLVQPPIIMH